eukprot:TRINITY_DN21237_c0_g1_i1.p1 TRINITY_DN21237_c0_g1~~TRINITY_DN21237_c0_g1_i1.p1  ORF type:complete len:129 (-),score=21.27 TRINITY_DN21237_c0_g1_i1:119-478(-)
MSARLHSVLSPGLFKSSSTVCLSKPLQVIMSSVLSALRGKVTRKTYQVKYPTGENKTPMRDSSTNPGLPFNSNLQMQGIRVVENNPVPDMKKEDAFVRHYALDRHGQTACPEENRREER